MVVVPVAFRSKRHYEKAVSSLDRGSLREGAGSAPARRLRENARLAPPHKNNPHTNVYGPESNFCPIFKVKGIAELRAEGLGYFSSSSTLKEPRFSLWLKLEIDIPSRLASSVWVILR